MVEHIVAGKKYKVINDSEENFKTDDIVVALDTSNFSSFCILEKHFKSLNSLMNIGFDYGVDIHEMTYRELAELE